MAARKWLVRSLYLAFLAALIGGGLYLYAWMRPEFIRGELTQQLTDKFNNVDVEIQSAHLRLLGGISVSDLRLIRRDDPSRTPFLQVPSAILHHDKEQLNNGKLVIRKVELFKPRLRIERGADGQWSAGDLLKPSQDDGPTPLFVLHEATIIFVDRKLGELPLAEWKDVEATIVNDPLPVFTFQMRGNGKPTGPFIIDGRFDKRTGFAGTIDLPNIPVNADLVRVVEAVAPEAVEFVKPLTAKASAHLDLVWQNGPVPAFYHDLRVKLKEGRYEHPYLPLPLEQIELSFRSKNWDLHLEQFTARAGQGTISVAIDLPKEPVCAPNTKPLSVPSITGNSGSLAPERSPLQEFEDRLRSVDVAVTNLMVAPDLFAKMPGKAASVKDMFMPSGPLSLSYTFRRHEGGWEKNLVIQPNGMDATYRGFPYRLRNVRGTVHHTVTERTADEIRIDLQGDGAGTTVSVKGTIKGSSPDVDVDLALAARNVTLDNELIDAMPDANPALLHKMHATAVGDLTASIRHNARIRREYGPDTFDNLFTINILHGSMKYEVFPYPLENISGSLIVRTVPERPFRLPATAVNPKLLESSDSTTLEFRDFQATRHRTKFRGSGRKDPAPGGSILTLSIDAESLELDRDLQHALKAIRMESSWKALQPSGRMNCAIRVKLFTKPDPEATINAPEDLELGMAFAGATVRPDFFPYQLNGVAGRVAYAKGRVVLDEFRAAHGASVLTLPYTEVLFRPSGGYWADVRDLRVNPLVIDDDFLQALPSGLKAVCQDLEVKGPLALHATRLVIDEQPGPYIPRDLPRTVRGAAPAESDKPKVQVVTRPVAPGPILPTIYWDGSITMAGASLKTGVTWEAMHGKLASWGLYQGDRLGAVRGNIVLDKALVAKQPVEALTAQLRVDPRQPDVLSIPAIRGKLYGGDVGGEAWVVLESPVRYALQLNAARVRLSEIARHYKLPAKAHLEGLATAQLYLANRFDERTGLPVMQGGGTIDVPSGKLLNLPVLLNLIKVVKLRVPDETGFEEAQRHLFLRGDRLKFGQLDLIGTGISLGGEGEMNLEGKDVHFEFYPVWTRFKEMFALPGEWTGAVSKKFLKIRVTGELDGKLDYKAEPVPGIVEPVKRVIERMKK